VRSERALLREKKNGYAIAREHWALDWDDVNTPLGLPGQTQAVCRRITYRALRSDLPEKESEYSFYVTSLGAAHFDAPRLGAMIREHWSVENRLHHVKDRTWLEDRHWVGNKRTGEMVTLLRSLASCLVRKARFPGLNPKAYCPERIEHFTQHPKRAVSLMKGEARL
jgi:hypothetical protein